jgi:hypothetical protein
MVDVNTQFTLRKWGLRNSTHTGEHVIYPKEDKPKIKEFLD